MIRSREDVNRKIWGCRVAISLALSMFVASCVAIGWLLVEIESRFGNPNWYGAHTDWAYVPLLAILGFALCMLYLLGSATNMLGDLKVRRLQYPVEG